MPRFCTLYVLALALGACDWGLDASTVENPTPEPVATDPAVVFRSGPVTQVNVVGRRFMEGAAAFWNGAERPSTVLSSTRLRVTLEAADVPEFGTASLTVTNPEPTSGPSEPLVVAVGHPVPSLTSVSPTAFQVPAPVTLTVQGSDFVTGPQGAQVRWNGIALPTDVQSSSEATATVPDYLNRAGSASITVWNPVPGGGSSGALELTVSNVAPTVTSVTPTHVVVGTDVTLQISGAGFVWNTALRYGDSVLAPTSRTHSAISAVVPGALNVSGDTVHVSVENPSPGGGLSGSFALPVWDQAARIDALEPAWAFTDTPSLQLTILGAYFGHASVVTWKSDALLPTLHEDTRIELALDAADLSLPGAWALSVTNPPPAGGGDTTVLRLLPGTPTSSYIARSAGGGIRLGEADGESDVLVPVESATQLDASSTRWQVAYYDGDGLRVYDMVARTDTHIDDGGRWPTFSPDGTWVYYTRDHNGSYAAFRARSDGSDVELVLDSAFYATPAHGSNRLVYTVVGSGFDDIRVRDPGTGGETVIGQGATPRWSPSDEWIVYRTRAGVLRAARPDGSENNPVGTTTGVLSFDWAPDGSSLIAATISGSAMRVSFPSGAIQTLPGLGYVESITFFGTP